MEDEITPVMACSPSSSRLVHRRIRARPKASAGRSAGSGKASSRYSQITVDSTITRPSCTSVGTTPYGFIARYSGVCWSPARRFM